MQGVVGMGGPAMVFWVQAHDWGTRRSRGFLFAMYLSSLLPALTILGLVFGASVFKAGIISALTIPLLLYITQLGLRAWNPSRTRATEKNHARPAIPYGTFRATHSLDPGLAE